MIRFLTVLYEKPSVPEPREEGRRDEDDEDDDV